MTAAAVLAAADAPDTGTDVRERLQRLEDTEAIRRLMSEYVRRLDAQDFAGFSRLFARNGRWTGGGGTVTGPDAIRDAMDAAFGPDSGAVWTSDFHLTGNAVVDVRGDTATAGSRWVFVSPSAAGAPAMMLAGRYDDEFVREDGVWRFQSRRLIQDMAHRDFPAIRQSLEDGHDRTED